MSASSLPGCSKCGSQHGPWVPSGEVLPTGEQVLVCTNGCPSGFSPEQRMTIAQQLGDAQPARDELLVSFAKSVADCREHEHPTWEDLFCMNLTAYMGERMAPVLRRLLDAEARVAELEVVAKDARQAGFRAAIDVMRAERLPMSVALLEAQLELDKLDAEPAPVVSPWQQAVDGLNALVDADVTFHVEPDGHVSNPFGDEHIEWDRESGRWVLTVDEDDAPAVVVPAIRRLGPTAATRKVQRGLAESAAELEADA